MKASELSKIVMSALSCSATFPIQLLLLTLKTTFQFEDCNRTNSTLAKNEGMPF